MLAGLILLLRAWPWALCELGRGNLFVVEVVEVVEVQGFTTQKKRMFQPLHPSYYRVHVIVAKLLIHIKFYPPCSLRLALNSATHTVFARPCGPFLIFDLIIRAQASSVSMCM